MPVTSPTSATSDRRNGVLIGVPLLSFAGVQRAVHSLGSSLDAQGLPTRWLVWQALDEEGERVREEWFGGAQDRLTVYPHWARRSLGAAFALVRFFGEQPERQVNLHYVTGSSVSLLHVLAARLARKRVVVSLHHPDEPREKRRALRRRISLALRLADAVVATTPYLADIARRWSPKASVQVIPLGVRVPEQYDRQAARKALSLPRDAWVVGFLARMWKGKGLPTVSRAVAQLHAEGRDIYVVAAGSGGPDFDELRVMVEQQLGDRGRFLGFVPDHHQMLATLDVFAMPSDSEGFGLTFVEAALQGVPSIGAGVQGVPYVIDDGQTGYLIDVGDEAGLASRLARLQDNPQHCRRLGDAARERALRDFTEQRMGERYKALFEALAGQNA